MRWVLILMLFTLASCSVGKLFTAAEKVGELSEDIKKISTEVNERIGDVKARIAAADSNKDGKVSWTEALLALLGTATAGGGALLLRNGKSKAEKAAAFAEIKHEIAALKAKA